MKRFIFKQWKKRSIAGFSLLIVFIFLTSGIAFAQDGEKGNTADGNAGDGASEGMNPLKVTAIVAGAMGAVVAITQAVTDDDDSSSTAHHSTPGHTTPGH